jgi:hypothetical protein
MFSARVRDLRLDFDTRVDLGHALRSRHGLRQPLARVCLREQRLALQIRLLDEVPIHDAQTPHAGARQRLDLRGAECPAADDEHARRAQPPLPLRADLLEENLSAVAFHQVN